MKRVILIITALALFSCEKKENSINISPDVIPTNHVVIRINSVLAMDSLVLTAGSYGSLVRAIRDESPSYFKDNVIMSLCCGVYESSDCGVDCLDLESLETIYLEYNGDLTIEYK